MCCASLPLLFVCHVLFLRHLFRQSPLSWSIFVFSHLDIGSQICRLVSLSFRLRLYDSCSVIGSVTYPWQRLVLVGDRKERLRRRRERELEVARSNAAAPASLQVDAHAYALGPQSSVACSFPGLHGKLFGQEFARVHKQVAVFRCGHEPERKQ
jgi:hypothetical protein